MKAAGQIALTPFPNTYLSHPKLRPVLLICKASVRYDDWLVCMVSSQLQQFEPELDEFIRTDDSEYAATGLKVSSVLRVTRLAVLQTDLMVGLLGEISQPRLKTVTQRIARWIEFQG